MSYSKVGSRGAGEDVMIKTVSEVLTKYLRKGNVDNKTGSRQRDDTCAIPLKLFFRGKSLSEDRARGDGIVTGEDVRSYREWRKTAGKKPSTVAREITVMSAAIRYWNRELDYEFRNVFEDRQWSKADKKARKARQRILTEEEVTMALEKTSGILMKDLIEFYLETGFRAREALKLRRDNVFGDMALLLAADTKGGEDEFRWLSPVAIEILARQPEHEYAFSRNDKPVSYWWVRDNWNKVRKAIGSPDLRIHDLRRTAGDDVRQKYSLEAAQAFLGHKSKSTTEAVYAPSKIDKLRKAVSLLDDKSTQHGSAAVLDFGAAFQKRGSA